MGESLIRINPPVTTTSIGAVAKGELVVNVKDYGAKGDGTTDDTTAIQAALTAATGATAFAPTGTYLAVGLTVPANTRLLLESNAKLKLPTGTSRTLVTLSGAFAAVEGGVIDGNASGQTSVGGTPLVSLAAADCRVTGVTVQNAKDYGIRASTNRPSIRNNQILSTGSNAIFVQPAVSTNIVGIEITGNLIDRTASGSSVDEGGIKIHGNTSATVLHNRISGNRVLLPASPTLAPPVGIEVFGGAHQTVVADNVVSGGSISISVAGSNDVTVTGNTCLGANVYGIELSGSANSSASGNTIDGQTITPNGVNLNSSSSNCTVGMNSITGCTGSGVKAQTSSGVSVVGNTIVSTGVHGIEFTGCTQVTAGGNTINGSSTALKAIMLDTSFPAAIVGNTMRNFTQHGVLLYAASAVTINKVVVVGNAFDTCNTSVGTSLSGGAALGPNVRVSNASGTSSETYDLLNNILSVTGSGSPEGVQTAGIGSTYHRSDGGSGTSLYVKSGGTGNTGWVAVPAAGTTNLFGFPATVDPGIVRATDNIAVPAGSTGIYIRVLEGGTISKVGLRVGTSSGNISVATYSNSGTGRSAVPGARTATSGAVACPTAGYNEIALGSSVTLNAGDWIGISADNGTAQFGSQLAAGGDSNLGLGRQFRQASAHPLPTTPASLVATSGYNIVLIGVA